MHRRGMRTGLRRAAGRMALLAGALAAVSALVVGTIAPAAAQSPQTFEITITNTTSPEMIITPGAYLVHNSMGAFWSAGGTAPLALERIAEVGEPGEAVAALSAVALTPAPAAGDSVTITIQASPGAYFSFAQMLIATNDGFVGVDSMPLWENGQPVSGTFDVVAWDAGTEANSDLFAGFAGGQPDPAQGAANLDNGTATSEPIAAHPQFAGAQATLTITPVTPALLPNTGSGGLADTGLGGTGGGGNALLWALVAAGSTLLGLGAVRQVARR